MTKPPADPPKHGGKRLGSGRPAKASSPRSTTSVNFDPDVLEYLESLSDSRSDLINKLLRKSAKFKEWAALKESQKDSGK